MQSTVTMKSRSASLFLVLLLPVLVAAVAAAVRKGPLLGGWKPIQDVKDPHVEEIGKFAVEEYNKESKGRLEYKGILSGETQVVAGINYRLNLEAQEAGSGSVMNYRAVVWEKSWENFMKLRSFEPLAR